MMEFLLAIGVLIVISGLLLLFGGGVAFAWDLVVLAGGGEEVNETLLE